MAIIINDFELVMPAPEPSTVPRSTAVEPSAPPRPAPEDVRAVVEHFSARAERVAAD